MKVIQEAPQIVHLRFDNQRDLTETFLRFQEHYESPEFRNKIFTLGQFREWYSKKYGGFTYYTDWNGFNIPNYVLKSFYNGLFDPLTEKEQKLLDLFKSRSDKFYIIGTHSGEEDAIDHEMRHAIYYLDDWYAEKCREIIVEHSGSETISGLISWLHDQGYCEDVIDDEIQAYLGADSEWLRDEKGLTVDEGLVKTFEALYAAATHYRVNPYETRDIEICEGEIALVGSDDVIVD